MFYSCLQATPVGASFQQAPIQLQSTQAKKQSAETTNELQK